MEESEVFDKLKTMISEQFDIDEGRITMNSSFIDDLAADSLDIVELVMNIEEQFGISISDEAAEEVSTVEDIVKYIVQNIA